MLTVLYLIRCKGRIRKKFKHPTIQRGKLNILKKKPFLLIKVIPQKLKLPMNCSETFLECFLPSAVSKNTIKMIGHHARLKDVTGQSFSIYACTRANHVRYSSVQVIF